MKGLGKIAAGAGVLLLIYSVVGRFVGGPTIGLGLVELDPKSGMIFANSLLLIAILLKLGDN